MMALGLFVFSLNTASYQELQRRTDWKHPTQSLVGARDASQFTGQGEETLTLSGSIVPEFKGLAASLDLLRVMANTGKSWTLIDLSGCKLGSFVITGVEETRRLFHGNGTARRIEFTINLRRTDQDTTSITDVLAKLAMSYVRGKL